MELRKRTLSPAEQAKLENTESQAEINRANIDYIAMMADVEIPTEEVSENAQSKI